MFNVEQDLYKSLWNIISERTNRIVAWVGSGLSRSAGLPSWSELHDRLCDVLEGKASHS